jgi:hypothetical protein
VSRPNVSEGKRVEKMGSGPPSEEAVCEAVIRQPWESLMGVRFGLRSFLWCYRDFSHGVAFKRAQRNTLLLQSFSNRIHPGHLRNLHNIHLFDDLHNHVPLTITVIYLRLRSVEPLKANLIHSPERW